jgi:hypothetical protein
LGAEDSELTKTSFPDVPLSPPQNEYFLKTPYVPVEIRQFLLVCLKSHIDFSKQADDDENVSLLRLCILLHEDSEALPFLKFSDREKILEKLDPKERSRLQTLEDRIIRVDNISPGSGYENASYSIPENISLEFCASISESDDLCSEFGKKGSVGFFCTAHYENGETQNYLVTAGHNFYKSFHGLKSAENFDFEKSRNFKTPPPDPFLEERELPPKIESFRRSYNDIAYFRIQDEITIETKYSFGEKVRKLYADAAIACKFATLVKKIQIDSADCAAQDDCSNDIDIEQFLKLCCECSVQQNGDALPQRIVSLKSSFQIQDPCSKKRGTITTEGYYCGNYDLFHVVRSNHKNENVRFSIRGDSGSLVVIQHGGENYPIGIVILSETESTMEKGHKPAAYILDISFILWRMYCALKCQLISPFVSRKPALKNCLEMFQFLKSNWN